MAGRIPESIDFEAVNRDVDALIQGAIGDLLNGNRKGAAGASTEVPSFQKANLDDLRNEVARTKSSREVAQAQIGEEQGNYLAAGTRRTAAIEAKGQAEAAEIAANAARAEQVAKIHRDLAISLGVDPEAIAEVAHRIKLERPKAEALLGEIKEMQAVGLLDNPLEWFVNQIQLPAKIEPYNTQAARINMLQNSLDAGLKTAQDAATHNSKGIASITAAQSVAGMDKVIQSAAIDKAVAEEALAKQNISFAQQKLANDLSVANLTKEMTQLEIQQNLSAYQAAIYKIKAADDDATRKLKAAELLEKLERTKGLDVILESYDRVMGHPKGTTNRYTFERFGKDQAHNIIAIGSGSIGSGPAEAVMNFIQGRPGPEIAAETARMFNYLQEKFAPISSNPEIQRLDQKEKIYTMNKKLREEVDRDIARSDVMGSVFYEMSPATMLASGKIPADSKLFKVLEPLSKVTGPVPTEVVIETIRKEFKNPVEAGQIVAEYYQRNITLRNTSMNAGAFGIKLPESYKAKHTHQEGPIWRNRGTYYDLTKPEEAVKYVLAKQVEEEIFKRMGNNPGSILMAPQPRIQPE